MKKFKIKRIIKNKKRKTKIKNKLIYYCYNIKLQCKKIKKSKKLEKNRIKKNKLE